MTEMPSPRSPRRDLSTAAPVRRPPSAVAASRCGHGGGATTGPAGRSGGGGGPVRAAGGERDRLREHPPGTPPSDWDISGSGSPTIQGFATAISVNPGDTVQFKINTPSRTTTSTSCGWATTRATARGRSRRGCGRRRPCRSRQPACRTDSPPTGLIDCGNWAVSASWTVPSTAVSGVYIAAPGPQRHERRKPHHLRRARRRRATPTSSSRPPTRRGRPTTPTAATASTRARRTARPGVPGLQGRLQGVLQPAVPHRRRRQGVPG